MTTPLTAHLAAITANLTAIETAYGAGNIAVVQQGLLDLDPLVRPLPQGEDLAAQARRLASGRSAIPRSQLDQVVNAIRTAKDQYVAAATGGTPPPTATPGSGVLGDPARHIVRIQGGGGAYVAREDQAYIAKRAGKHFRTADASGQLPKRGIFRMDTGMGKSLTYAFSIQEMRRTMPDVFNDAVVVIGCHQGEPARDVADQVKAVFPTEGVANLEGGLKKQDLKDVKFVAGTYQQLATEGTVDLLKQWAGRRPILFVLDEADMVVFKGIHVDKNDEPDETGWHPSWFKPFQEFGLFDQKGRYNPKTRHYMLGGSATLDRPDGITLSTVWGPGNIFYHTPMAEGIRKGYLVPTVGKVLEMEIPEDADPAQFREFTKVEDGKIVVDQAKVLSAAGSDYAVKTAVRAYMDNIFMEVGVGKQKGKDIREAIGYASDGASLEKHMRWQQELFDLIEQIFQIQNGLGSTKGMRADTVVRTLGGAKKLRQFGETLKRFLYAREWKQVAPLYERALAALEGGTLHSVRDLFTLLYRMLNVEARKIKGRRLLCAAVWQDMDQDDEGHKIPRDSDDLNIDTAVRRFPNKKWPNRFGPRSTTMKAVKSGNHDIDIVWSIGMLDRGFNAPQRSLIIDNSPTDSRRMLVQRAGRIMRPPNGRNPTDHSQKPDALYITVTANVEAHKVDLSRQDLARAFGTEMHPELNLIRFQPEGGDAPWTTPDTLQLDLKDGTILHLVRVGANTSKAVTDFLRKKYKDAFDPEVIAFDADAPSDDIAWLLAAIKFPKKGQLQRWLKNWGASDDTIRLIMATYDSDLADMKTVYGSAWKIVSRN